MTQNITPRSAVDGIAHLLTKTGELKVCSIPIKNNDGLIDI